MNSSFSMLFEHPDKYYADVLITVDNGAMQYKGHRCVLATRSGYFEKVLRHGGREIAINEVRPQAFERIIRYIYTEEVMVMEDDELIEQLTAADYFELTDLRTLLHNQLQQRMIKSVETCCCVAVQGFLIGDAEIYNPAVRLLIGNGEQLLRCEKACDLPLQLVIKIISSDDLVVGSELSIYTFCTKWFINNKSTPDAISIFDCVRLTLIPPKDIATQIESCHFVSPDVIAAAYRSIALCSFESSRNSY